MASIYDEFAAIAADPHTDWDTLHWIAEKYPELRPAVAENPATYPELLDALRAIGDPEIDSALARRHSQPRTPVPPETAASSAGPARSAKEGSSSWWIATPEEATPSLPVETTSAAKEEWFSSGSSDSDSFAAPTPAPAPGETVPPSTGPARRRRPFTSRLLLAVALPLVALVAVAALVMNLWTGSDAAGDSSADTSAVEAAPPDTGSEQSAPGESELGESEPDAASTDEAETPPTEDELRDTVAALPEESSCEAAEEDRAALTAFGATAGEDAAWSDPADASLVEETLLALQESCGSSHAARIYLDLQGSAEDVPAALRATVESMGPAWIRTGFPAQGQPLESFAAPGGNVVCELGDALRCTVLEHSFSAPEGCTGGVTYAIEVDRAAEPACGDPVEPAGQPELGYGQTASNEFFACSSFQSQMSCWNQLTGEGINLSASRNATY